MGQEGRTTLCALPTPWRETEWWLGTPKSGKNPVRNPPCQRLSARGELARMLVVEWPPAALGAEFVGIGPSSHAEPARTGEPVATEAAAADEISVRPCAARPRVTAIDTQIPRYPDTPSGSAEEGLDRYPDTLVGARRLYPT